MDDIQEKVLNELKKGKSVKEAASVINTVPLIVDRWIRLGKKGEGKYVEFYEEYRKIILKETTEKTNNATNSEEIIDRFLKLLEINVSYEDILNILDIPDSKMNNFYKQGKLGIKPYDKLYNAIEQAKKRQKINNLKDNKTKVKKTSNNIDSLNKKNKKCVICGKELSKYTSKDKCKTCSRSIYVANILNDLLKFITPEVPFFKEDLRKLNYNDVEIKGIIWTLIDFDLIEQEKNNKYSLKNKKTLDDFLSEWKEYIVETNENDLDNRGKLIKTCKVCKKELSTSKFSPSENGADGLKDYCKDCAKQVDAAKSLKIILNYVNAEEEFFKEDLYQHYPEAFLVEATIFSLQENDLINSNFEEMTYSLKNESILNEFLDKYLIEEPKIPKGSLNTQKPKHITHQTEQEIPIGELSLEEKMDIVLKALKEGKSRKEAFKLIDENSSLLITWKLLGKKGTEPYDYFYEEYSNIKTPTTSMMKKAETVEEQEELDKFLSWKNKRDLFIKGIIDGKTFKEASKKANIDEKLVNRWISFGKSNKEYYFDFANEYKEARETAENRKEEIKNNAKNQVIAYIKQGYTLEEAAAEIKTFSSSTIIGWYNSGRKGEKSNKEFYEKCEVANHPENKRFGEIKFTNDLSLNLKLNIFLEEVKEGNTIRQSSKIARLEEKNVIKFINYGKKRIKPYTKFAEEYIKARDISEERDKEKRKIAKNKTVEYIKQGYDLKTAVTKVEEFSDGAILGWHLSGKRGNEIHKQFYKDCEKALLENEIKFSKYVTDPTLNKKLNIFINEIVDGKSIKEASKKANIDEKQINKYISDGKRGIKPYTRFAEEYIEARKYAESKKEEIKNNAKDQVIKYIEHGYELEEAAEKIKTFSSSTIIGWYHSGRRGEKSNKQFYKDCEYAKKHKNPKKTIQTRITDTKLSDKEIDHNNIEDNFNLTIKEDNANKKLWEILIKGETNFTNFISILSNLENYKNQMKKIMTENNGENRLKVLIKLNIDKKEAKDIRKLADIIDDIKSKIKIE